MDRSEPFPLTLAGLEERLRRGETFEVAGRGIDGLTYALWFQEGRFWLRQGKDLHAFKQLEVAVLTMLTYIGGFAAPSSVFSLADTEQALRRGVLTPMGARKLGFPDLANCEVEYLAGSVDTQGGGYTRWVYYQGKKLGGILALGPEGVLPIEG